MSWLSDVIGGFTGKAGADAISDSADKASETSLAMFDKATALNEPFRVAGLNALSQQGALLGMPGMVSPGVVNESLMAGPAGGSVWEAYGQQNPGVVDYFKSNPGALAKFDGDMNKALEYHYNTYGKSEGRKLPTLSGGTNALDGVSGAGFTGATADPYQTFLDSGFGKSMLETTSADFDNMVGAFGAAGNALSGSAIGALNDRNRRNESTAFGNYYNALSGISGTGANIGAQQGQQAIATGDRIAANTIAAGDARASSYGQGANALGKLFSNVGSYGASKGWF